MKSGGANCALLDSLLNKLHRNRTSLNRIADHRVVFPVFAVCTAAVCIPLAFSVVFSFCSVNADGSFEFGTIDGYRALLTSGRIGEIIKIVIRAATVTAFTMAISVPAAFWIASIRHKTLQGILLALLVTPWLVSDMLRAFGWQLILAPDGPVSDFWRFLSGMGPLENLRYQFSAVVIGLVSAMLPAGTLSVFAAIPDRNRNEWLSAAEIGSPRDVLRIMLFGRARGGIILGFGIVFTLGCFASAEARFLDGPTQSSVQTIAASLVNVGVPALLAFGTTLILLVVCCCFLTAVVYRLASRGKGKPQEFASMLQVTAGGPAFAACFRRKISRSNRMLTDWAASLFPPLAGGLALLISAAPVLAVGAEAFWRPGKTGGRWTLENFQLMLSSDDLVQACVNSALVAGCVAIVATALAFILSLVMWEKRLHFPVAALCILLVVLPGDAYAISLMQFFKLFRPAEGSWVFVVLSHVLWALPFGVGTLILANRHINRNALRASLEYSRGPLSVILRFVARGNFGRLAGVAVLAGTLSLNDFLRTSYLGGGLLTVGNVVHGRLTAGLLPANRGIFAVEFLVLVTSIVAVVLLIVGINSSSSKSNSGYRNRL